MLGSLTVVEILLLVRFNDWLGTLFDVLQRRAVAELLPQCVVLAALVLGTALQAGAHLRCRRELQLRWRRWLTERLAAGWLRRQGGIAGGVSGGMAAAEAGAGRRIANADGRIAEDIRIATEEAVELGSSIWQAVLLLLSFGHILWGLSGSPVLTAFGVSLQVPGYLVWLAVLYAAVSGVAALALGRPLVRATDARQAAEAEFRAALVRLADGQAGARSAGPGLLRRLFVGVSGTWRGQSRNLAQLSAFNAGHARLTTTFPILAGLPGYLQEVVTLGGLMQGAQAFQQLAAALTWPVTSMERVALWGASAERVLALHATLAAEEGKAREEKAFPPRTSPLLPASRMLPRDEVSTPRNR